MLNINDINRSNIEYKSDVIKQVKKAENYLTSFKWCKKIIEGWLAESFAYMLCIFLFELEPSENSNADNKIWIIIGDIPPAYLDIETYPTLHEALDFYCYLMEEWIDHVNNGKSLEKCYPINVPATKKYADMLQSRINIIKEDFLPFI